MGRNGEAQSPPGGVYDFGMFQKGSPVTWENLIGPRAIPAPRGAGDQPPNGQCKQTDEWALLPRSKESRNGNHPSRGRPKARETVAEAEAKQVVGGSNKSEEVGEGMADRPSGAKATRVSRNFRRAPCLAVDFQIDVARNFHIAIVEIWV